MLFYFAWLRIIQMLEFFFDIARILYLENQNKLSSKILNKISVNGLN